MKYSFCVFLDTSKRIDMYLSILFNDFSRAYIQKMIDKGQVKVNDKVLNKNKKIKNKDKIEVVVKIEKMENILAQKIPLDIIYEDENILIINKNAKINVHPVPGENGKIDTLVNGILYHCKKNLPVINGVERPGIVHRLDKDTSGIILIAKNNKMMSYLSDIIKNRQIDKYYIAIVFGKLKKQKIKIESYIGRDLNNRQKMTTRNPINPKIAISYVEVLDYIEDKYSVLKVKIETGRTHQIRVHLASIGYPILGDKVYGNEKVNREVYKKYSLDRQALHAFELEFNLYGKKRKFVAPLKDDIKKILKKKIEF